MMKENYLKNSETSQEAFHSKFKFGKPLSIHVTETDEKSLQFQLMLNIILSIEKKTHSIILLYPKPECIIALSIILPYQIDFNDSCKFFRLKIAFEQDCDFYY